MRKILEKEIQSISGGYYFGFCNLRPNSWYPGGIWRKYLEVFDSIGMIRQVCCDVQHGEAWAYTNKINTQSEDQIKVVLLEKNNYRATNDFVFNEAVESKMQQNIDSIFGEQNLLGWRC